MNSARMRTRNCNPPEPTWVSRVEDALRTADDFLSVGEIVQRIQGSSNRVTAALCSLPPLPSRRLSGKRRQAVLVCDAADRHAHPPSRDAQTRRPRQSSCTPHDQRKENRAMMSRMQLMRRAVRLWKNPHVDRETTRHNQRAWLRSVERLGDRWLLAKPVHPRNLCQETST